MNIGIPKEISKSGGIQEKRVGLTPSAVHTLVEMGSQVFVEKGAGIDAGFSDEDYKRAGAQIVYSKEEVYGRGDLIIKVRAPERDELKLLKDRQTIMGYLHLATFGEDSLKIITEKKVTAIGYEVIEKEDGSLPVLKPMSQIAGKLSVQIAGRLLQSTTKGGKGILLSGIPGVPPAKVLVLGAGILGSHAAESFSGIGSDVYVMDNKLSKLEEVEKKTRGNAKTLLFSKKELEKLIELMDVVIGAVLVPGARTPILITEDMVRSMKRGSVLIDFSVDQGGCSQTTRLTPSEEFVYIHEGVIHFAVPNVPSWVARTATQALSNALLPYLQSIITGGLSSALKTLKDLSRGVYIYEGYLTHPHLPFDSFKRQNLDALLMDN